MRCHYEVLGLEKDCEDSEIKKAYRKSALVWHPDKNQHRKEEAEERFKEICNAYEVLSDAHERAWYDSHREAILRSGERHQTGGGADFAGGHKPDSEPDLFQFFSSSAFCGYNDGPKGFYTVYSHIFAKIAEQETALDEKRTWPSFGLSGLEAAQVSSFYANWCSFSSCKTFSWADQYNPAAAPNRQVRRRMEEENKKARKSAKKEYNDTVRELVLFVKKRDKRLIAIQQAEAAKKAEREAAEAARRKEEREARQRKAESYVEADWIRASEEAMESSEEEEEDEEEEQEEFYCVVCDKSFKSDKQLENHVRSKKHKQKLAELRAELEQEEELLTGLDAVELDAEAVSLDGPGNAGIIGGNGDFSGEDFPPSSLDVEGQGDQSSSVGDEEEEEEEDSGESEEESEEEDDEDAMLARMMGLHKSMANSHHSDSESDEEEEDEDEDEDAMLARMMGMHRSKSDARHSESEEDENEEEDEEEEEDEDAMLARMMGMQTSRAEAQKSEDTDNEEEGSEAEVRDDEEAVTTGESCASGVQDGASERDEMLAGLMANSCKPSSGWMPAGGNEPPEDERQQSRHDGNIAGVPPGGKAKGKGKPGRGKGKQGKAAPELTCKVCGLSFESRTQLFKHITATGHAALKR